MRSLPLSQKLFRNAYVNVMRLTDRLVDGYYRLAVARPDSKFSKFVIGRKNVLNYIRRNIDIDSSRKTVWIHSSSFGEFAIARPLISTLADHTSPHYTFLLTQSSHTPFDVPYHKLKDEKLNAFAYTDESIGEFLNELKRTPAWANLMVIITADDGFRYGAFSDPPYHHIPLLVTGGTLAKKSKDSRIISQTDIPAMILGQLRLPHDDFQFSRDIMSKNYSYPFSFSTFVNGFTFRDSTGVTVYDNVLRKAVHYPRQHPYAQGQGDIAERIQETQDYEFITATIQY